MIAIEGQLRTRTYDDKKGSRHYITEVYVDNISFTGESKQQAAPSNYSAQQPAAANEPPTNISIGDIEDFEEILNDDGVPF